MHLFVIQLSICRSIQIVTILRIFCKIYFFSVAFYIFNSTFFSRWWYSNALILLERPRRGVSNIANVNDICKNRSFYIFLLQMYGCPILYVRFSLSQPLFSMYFIMLHLIKYLRQHNYTTYSNKKPLLERIMTLISYTNKNLCLFVFAIQKHKLFC